MKVKWHGDEFQRKLAQHQRNNIETAAVFLTGDIKRAFPDTGKKGMATKGERRAQPSAPGEIPHVDTGTLRRSIDYLMIPGQLPKAQVGIIAACRDKNRDVVKALEYALYLELGTEKMAQRPYLRPAISRNMVKLRQLMTRKMPG
jgi:hypothetical protein